MTFEIALVLGILTVSLILFVSEVIRMDLVALLVLCALAVTGLVSSTEAFAGFSNSAVITVWAMFILSEGLTRTGIADIIGRQVIRLAGRREIAMIIVIMITAAVLIRIHEQYRGCGPDVASRHRRSKTNENLAITPVNAAGLCNLVRRPDDHDRYAAQPAGQRDDDTKRLRALRAIRFHADWRCNNGHRRDIRCRGRTPVAAENEAGPWQTSQPAQSASTLQAARTNLHDACADGLYPGRQNPGAKPHWYVNRPDHSFVDQIWAK